MPGKQVLGAAREADDLVREHRPADEDVVVLDDQPVQRDRHVLRAAARRSARRSRRAGIVPSFDERRGIVPAVIEDARARQHARRRPARPNERGQLRVGHRHDACRARRGNRAPPTRGPSARSMASNISGIGIVRVPSGMRTSTRRPSTGSAASASSVMRATSPDSRQPSTRPRPTMLNLTTSSSSECVKNALPMMAQNAPRRVADGPRRLPATSPSFPAVTNGARRRVRTSRARALGVWPYLRPTQRGRYRDQGGGTAWLLTRSEPLLPRQVAQIVEADRAEIRHSFHADGGDAAPQDLPADPEPVRAAGNL